MLYLARKAEQGIMVNNEIEIKVVSIRKNSVVLGIKYPEHAVILRKEVYDRITAENLAANYPYLSEDINEDDFNMDDDEDDQH